jgi:hypothetical protein
VGNHCHRERENNVEGKCDAEPTAIAQALWGRRAGEHDNSKEKIIKRRNAEPS